MNLAILTDYIIVHFNVKSLFIIVVAIRVFILNIKQMVVVIVIIQFNGEIKTTAVIIPASVLTKKRIIQLIIITTTIMLWIVKFIVMGAIIIITITIIWEHIKLIYFNNELAELEDVITIKRQLFIKDINFKVEYFMMVSVIRACPQYYICAKKPPLKKMKLLFFIEITGN